MFPYIGYLIAEAPLEVQGLASIDGDAKTVAFRVIIKVTPNARGRFPSLNPSRHPLLKSQYLLLSLGLWILMCLVIKGQEEANTTKAFSPCPPPTSAPPPTASTVSLPRPRLRGTIPLPPG
ncbi:uncharacterized protein N7483_003924 [Penicillium malachiteum]|uniref:uncharacterized protein n=1 Tax=Penicillium malachiteum TaxID=1324776 RepID=UPI002548E678|nr:uncharacterized protein N7483_003924 [Penicillium malachiteum]KAJ5729416.1 hypothetical protein N7483_003924 [Penicillium malachiteum]